MADGSHVDRAGPKQLNDLTFSAPYTSFKRLGDSKKFSDETFNGSRVKLSFYRELDQSESSEKSDKDGGSVAATRAVFSSGSRKSTDGNASATDGDDRKKRCIDRYDSSESSDSGVAVLSPSGSGGSCSDIGEERSPYSPESGCSTSEEGTSGSSRMPPWASEPAPQPPPAEAPRRIAVQPAPVRRHNPHSHRRITEFFNHKMKPQNGLKRDHNPNTQDDPKKKYPKNGVTHELEKYISYLSHTFSPKVLMDVGRLNEVAARKPINLTFNGSSDTNTADSSSGNPSSTLVNGMGDHAMNKDSKERVHTTMNGFMEVRRGIDSFGKDKPQPNNGYKDNKKKGSDKRKLDPSANGVNKVSTSIPKGKVPIPALPMPSVNRSPIKLAAKPDNRMNGAVSSTTKLDSRMNGVMCGSNNLSLNPISHKLMPMKKNSPKKNMDSQTTKKTNRKSSACIANSKNLTWSKANNLKQKCINSNQRSSVKNTPAETNCKINIPNGIRQVPMAVNANLGNINLPMNNLQNCHQINIPQPCNGTTSNMASFVAVPQNMMLTALRIPQTGIQTQTLGQQNNMTAFNSQNVNVPSPTKLNGQFVFPLMQNINGTVVQIPNLMAKMPNFVLPQNAQLAAQRQDQLQNQTTQILINGTLLKLANAMPGPAYTSINKNGTINTQPTINKTVPGVPTVGMTVQQKPNYTVEFSHPVLVRQPGFFVTSVPNMNVKETWSCTGSPATSLPSSTMFPGTNASSMQSTCSDQMYPGSTTPSILTSSCSNPIFPGSTAASIQTSCSTQIYTASSATRLHSSYSDQILLQGPPLVSYTNQTIHTSSIPIAPVKPPDNPIQGTEPPSSTVKEPDMCEDTSSTKCDIPWLSKTVNNNIVSVQKSKKRRFAEVSSSFSDKFDELLLEIEKVDEIEEDLKMEDESDESRTDFVDDDMRKVEEVARREDTIFTQITVLKDVSSNVHSSLIEANFCNAATESESGIGTDKSIDSPSESLTSKEGDDDSCLSLSISLSSVEVQSQKSPILKQPKTLRFPPRVLTKAESKRASRSVTSGTSTVCLWENCKREFDGDPDLLEHIQSTHVETQAGRENYVCLWERCKVFGKPSCSRLWLERHTLSHGGSKPFKCIVDGCERRFSTQILLEKHVNNHFNESSPNASGPKKSADSASKLIRRNGKKLRYRRQPWSARMFDFFDAGMMEGLAWRLLRCTRWRLGGGCLLTEPARSRHVLTLHAALAATRYNALTMQREALITYYPPHVVEDEWVSEKDVNRVKRVEMASLPAHVKVTLYELFCDSYRKAAAPPPDKKQTRIPLVPTRLLPARNCASSRLLNNLIAKQRQSIEVKADLKRGECNAPSAPMLLKEADRSDRVEVSGAKKRKLGRRYGGNAFWPCGR